MRILRIMPLFIVAALLLGGCADSATAPARQGDAAPSLAVTTRGGTPSLVSAAPGRALWLNFWASWCAPCRAEWPGLNTAQRNMAAEGLELVAINVNEQADAVERFLTEQPASFEVMLDPQGQAAARYGVIGFPTHVLIDNTGVVRAIVRGPLDEARARRLLDMPGDS